MDKPVNIKGICNRFIGTFHKDDWETIMEMGKSDKKLRVKVVDTANNQGLIITSKNGVFNLYAEKEDSGKVTGSLFLKGDSVSDIINLPIWKLFDAAAQAFKSNAVIHFYPTEGMAMDYSNGIPYDKLSFAKPELGEKIGHFLDHVRVDYLLGKLNHALRIRDERQVHWIKNELNHITKGRSSNL